MDIYGQISFGENQKHKEFFKIYVDGENEAFFENEQYYILCRGLLNPSPLKAQQIANKILNGALSESRDEIECSAIFIDKLKKQCFIITDPLGCYPIYYTVFEHRLFFSNTQKTLMKVSPSPTQWKINKQVLFELFHLGVVSPPDTLISNIHSIPVSHYLTYNLEIRLLEFACPPPHRVTYNIEGHMDLLKTCIEMHDSEKIHILCSGGLDSSLLLAISRGILNKEVIAHTVAIDKTHAEYKKTQFLQQQFAIKNHYFYPLPNSIYSKIDESILAGESEVVGALSVNAALEFSFAKSLLQHTFSLMTGDDNAITPTSLEQQAPGYYHLKYGLLSPIQSKNLLIDATSSMLVYVNKSKNLFTSEDKYKLFKQQRLLIHSTMIGKITAKYRNGLNPLQRSYMPLNNSIYRRYIDSHNYYKDNKYNYRDSLKQLICQYKLLPQEYFKNTKAWMPAVWNLAESQSNLHEMYQIIINDELIKELFHFQQLPFILIKQNQKYNIPLLLTLFYLIRFCKLFHLSY